MSRVDDQIRFATFLSMTERGIGENDAGAAMYAIHPFESDLPCARSLEKPVRKRAKRLARELRKAPPGDVGRIAITALQEYEGQAEACGDATYRKRFRLLLEKYSAEH